MNTITQLVTPAEYSAVIDTSKNFNNQKKVRKLLLVDGKSNDVSADVSDKLKNLASSVVEITQGCAELFTKVSALQPDVLIITVATLEQSIINELYQVKNNCPLPVIVIADEYPVNLLEHAVHAGISSYLVDKVSVQRLAVIVDFSIIRFKQEQSLITQLQETKEKLSERKIIARAKGIIMKQNNLSEEEAYSQMRKSAMDQGQSIAELSKRIISVLAMLD